MKLIAILLDENYKNIDKRLYVFDNEFIINNFDSSSKIIELERNKNYYRQFDGSIENISCIVGQNGKGKTTLFEILISLKLWRLDNELKEGKIHALFYDLSKNIFFIQSYIDNASNWSLKNFDLKKFDITNKNTPTNINNNTEHNDKFSIMPTPISIIFHSLSPFDRIHGLIKDIYNPNKGTRLPHYQNFGYIGVNPILDNEPSHAILTTKNLLFYSTTSEQFKYMLESIGYKFQNIEICINESYFNKKLDIVEFEDINIQKLDIENFNEITYNKIKSIVCNYDTDYSDMLNDGFYNYLTYLNLKIDKFANFKRFLKLAIEKFPNLEISQAVESLIKNITDIDVIKTGQIFNKDFNSYVKSTVENKESFKAAYRFLTEGLTSLNNDNFEYFYKVLQYIIFLDSKRLVNFKINLEKNGNKIDYLRLSSGEKTMLSYLFNLYNKILELYSIAAKTDFTKTVSILIDEVELHLHPEWQRQFVNNINKFFGAMQDVRLQFIIATHSPIILSDILSQNTIFLGNNEIDNTQNSFGGNILDIYKDKFFINHTMGEFSRNFIEQFSNSLNFIYAYEMKRYDNNDFLLITLIERFNLQYKDKLEEYNYLLEEIDTEYINRTYIDKYINNKNDFLQEAECISSSIGEVVIREYLNSIIKKLREYDKRNINEPQ